MTKKKDRIGRPPGHRIGCKCFVCKAVDKRPAEEVKGPWEVAEETEAKRKQAKAIPLEKCTGGANLTDDEVKSLAMDIYLGKVFTDRHITSGGSNIAGMVFMPLVFLDDETRKDFIENPPGMIYEHLDKAGPRSINGMPIFWSMRMVNGKSTKKVWDKYEEVKGKMEEMEASL